MFRQLHTLLKLNCVCLHLNNYHYFSCMLLESNDILLPCAHNSISWQSGAFSRFGNRCRGFPGNSTRMQCGRLMPFARSTINRYSEPEIAHEQLPCATIATAIINYHWTCKQAAGTGGWANRAVTSLVQNTNRISHQKGWMLVRDEQRSNKSIETGLKHQIFSPVLLNPGYKFATCLHSLGAGGCICLVTIENYFTNTFSHNLREEKLVYRWHKNYIKLNQKDCFPKGIQSAS